MNAAENSSSHAHQDEAEDDNAADGAGVPSSWLLFVLVRFFPALLPPLEDDNDNSNTRRQKRRKRRMNEDGQVVEEEEKEAPRLEDYYVVLGLVPSTQNATSANEPNGTASSHSSTTSSSVFQHHRTRRTNRKKFTAHDIRQAYRKRSLQLHPDKVLQRGGDPTAAAAEYQRVQEAYACLSDPNHRKIYHQLGCSVKRYQFWMSGGLFHPMAVYENLSQASTAHKTRMVLFCCLVSILILLQPMLIAAKINAVAQERAANSGNDDDDDDSHALLSDTSWTLLLIPLWIFQGMQVLGLGGLVVVLGGSTVSAEARMQRYRMALAMLEQVCWFVGCLFAAFAWDDMQHVRNQRFNNENVDDNDGLSSLTWQQRLIPIYAAIGLKLYNAVLQIRHVRQEQATMVSPTRLENLVQTAWQEFQEGRRRGGAGNDNDVELASSQDPDNAAEAEWEAHRRALEEHYTVVTVDEMASAAAMELLRQEEEEDGVLSEEDAEAVRVQSSSEFQAAESSVQQIHGEMGRWLLVATPMVVLIGLKLQGNLSSTWSWWMVFLPVWVAMGWTAVSSCFSCCCVMTSVVPPPHPTPTENHHAGVVSGGGDHAAAPAATTMPNGQNQENHVLIVGQSDEVSNPSTMQQQQQQTLQDDHQAGQGTIDVIAGATGATTTEALTASSSSSAPKAEEKAASVDSMPPSASSPSLLNRVGSSDSGAAATTTTTSPPPQLNQSNSHENSENNNTNQGAQVGSQSDPEFIAMDEETFQAWQSAQKQAESDAMEQQARAQSNLCQVIFQGVMIALLVGKLNQDFDRPDQPFNDSDTESNSQDGSVGYNAFWVLFPVFIVTGLILCCCCCLIYGIGGDEEDEMEGHGGGDANDTTNAESPTGSGDRNPESNHGGSHHSHQETTTVMMMPPTSPPAVLPTARSHSFDSDHGNNHDNNNTGEGAMVDIEMNELD